jgi:Tetracyclin repressor-like, C-terminal domain
MTDRDGIQRVRADARLAASCTCGQVALEVTGKPFELVLAHIEEALDEDDATTSKAAFLLTALVNAPDMMEPARRYYRALFDPLLPKSRAAQDVRHALLAVEGMFLLRGLGFVEFSMQEHRAVLLHARDIVAGLLAKRRK